MDSCVRWRRRQFRPMQSRPADLRRAQAHRYRAAVRPAIARMATREETTATDARATGNWREVLAAFLRLGLTSFGGPVAHLGYFREEFVHRRRWLDDKSYADLVALCQFLPGPASSQVGLAVGLLRGGYAG